MYMYKKGDGAFHAISLSEVMGCRILILFRPSTFLSSTVIVYQFNIKEFLSDYKYVYGGNICSVDDCVKYSHISCKQCTTAIEATNMNVKAATAPITINPHINNGSNISLMYFMMLFLLIYVQLRLPSSHYLMFYTSGF